MISKITKIAGRRVVVASAVAFTWLLANPLLPAGLSADAGNIGAAFAKHGADDAANDNGHHVGEHQRHGGDDGRNHDANDDHGGKRSGHK